MKAFSKSSAEMLADLSILLHKFEYYSKEIQNLTAL